MQNGPFGLHSFHVGAPTAAANTGQVGTARLRRQLKELEELMKQKKQKKFAEKKEEEGRLVLVLRRTGKGPEDYDFLPAMV